MSAAAAASSYDNHVLPLPLLTTNHEPWKVIGFTVPSSSLASVRGWAETELTLLGVSYQLSKSNGNALKCMYTNGGQMAEVRFSVLCEPATDRSGINVICSQQRGALSTFKHCITLLQDRPFKS